MKYIKIFIITIIMLFYGIINCYAEEVKLPNGETNSNITTPNISISKNKKVYDMAKLYSDGEEKKLENRIKNYTKNTKMDAVIVTVDDLSGVMIAEYAQNFYNYGNFKDNTVIFVIYIKEVEPEIYMYAVGDEATKHYTDNRIGEILKYVYKYISVKEYYNATDKYLTIIDGFYNIDSEESYTLNGDGKIIKVIPWIEIITLAAATTFILVMTFLYRIKANNKVSKSNNLDLRLNNETLLLKTEKDELIDTIITK